MPHSIHASTSTANRASGKAELPQLSLRQQQRAEKITCAWIDYANAVYDGLRLRYLPVHFDLRGRAAGMYCRKSGQRWFRYNPVLFAQDFTTNEAETIPHEVAHYVVDALFARSRRRPRPHGSEWQSVMLQFGLTPSRTHDQPVDARSVRRMRQFAYLCSCRVHKLSAIRHGRVSRGERNYLCAKCGELLAPANFEY